MVEIKIQRVNIFLRSTGSACKLPGGWPSPEHPGGDRLIIFDNVTLFIRRFVWPLVDLTGVSVNILCRFMVVPRTKLKLCHMRKYIYIYILYIYIYILYISYSNITSSTEYCLRKENHVINPQFLIFSIRSKIRRHTVIGVILYLVPHPWFKLFKVLKGLVLPPTARVQSYFVNIRN